MLKFYSFLFLIFIGINSFGAVITLKSINPCNVIGTGCDWNTATNWDLNRVPQNGDIIVIPSGYRVNVGTNTPSSGALENVILRIYGTLWLGAGTKLEFDANSVLVGASGATEILTNGGSKIKIGTSEITGGATYSGPFIHKTLPYGFNTSPSDAEVRAALPVKLSSFLAIGTNNTVNLKWETAQESNNKEFELQRSANGKDWATIAVVAGKGTTDLVSNYAYTDRAPLSGISLYRLKQIDYDGKNEISQVVAVKIGNKGILSFDVLPNMVVNNFKVVASDDLGSADISIYNTVGNRMNVQLSKNGNEVNVDASNLSSGQYIIKIQNGSETMTKRFVVNK